MTEILIGVILIIGALVGGGIGGGITGYNYGLAQGYMINDAKSTNTIYEYNIQNVKTVSEQNTTSGQFTIIVSKEGSYSIVMNTNSLSNTVISVIEISTNKTNYIGTN